MSQKQWQQPAGTLSAQDSHYTSNHKLLQNAAAQPMLAAAALGANCSTDFQYMAGGTRPALPPAVAGIAAAGTADQATHCVLTLTGVRLAPQPLHKLLVLLDGGRRLHLVSPGFCPFSLQLHPQFRRGALGSSCSCGCSRLQLLDLVLQSLAAAHNICAQPESGHGGASPSVLPFPAFTMPA